jgi:hypothetical protein
MNHHLNQFFKFRFIVVIFIIALSPLSIKIVNAATKFDIPDGSFYICKNKKTEDMLIQIMYSRTTSELVSVIAYSPNRRIDKILTWSFFMDNQGVHKNEFRYKITNLSSAILTIFPTRSSVSIAGDGSLMEFVNCMMIKN